MKRSTDQHFMICMNENCNNYHLVSPNELYTLSINKDSIDVLLCDDCKSKKDEYHIIQCISCRTIIEFIPILPGEISEIIYIEKCSNCGASLNDELKFIEKLFKHLHV